MQIIVANAQYPITFHHSFSDWARHTSRWVSDAARRGATLLVFPEYGTMELASLLTEAEKTDLHRQVAALNDLKANFLEVFAGLAQQWGVLIVAPSFPVLEDDKTYNRAYVFSPKGLIGYQDKLFMTRFEDEDWGIQSAPAQLSLFDAAWGSFGVQICYDIEFPIGAQVLCAQGAKLIVAPSCTETIQGAARVHVGARARALENQCYVAVSQTVGDAPWSPTVDINYGYAAVYSAPDKGLPEEGIIGQMTPQQGGWLIQEIDFQKIESVRTDGQVFNFKHQRRLGYTLDGSALVVRRFQT